MPVPLRVMCDVTLDRTPVWDNFICHMEKRNSFDVEGEADQELNKYGAFTNWRDDMDPVWFPDPESLTAFVLVWS